jgi:hypothetical protein
MDSALHDRLEGALQFLDKAASEDSYAIIGEVFEGIYRALRRAGYFTTHDQFDVLTAGIREELYQDLRGHLDGNVHIQDIERILMREFGMED